jgi:hypothetical protein
VPGARTSTRADRGRGAGLGSSSVREPSRRCASPAHPPRTSVDLFDHEVTVVRAHRGFRARSLSYAFFQQTKLRGYETRTSAWACAGTRGHSRQSSARATCSAFGGPLCLFLRVVRDQVERPQPGTSHAPAASRHQADPPGGQRENGRTGATYWATSARRSRKDSRRRISWRPAPCSTRSTLR